MNDTHLPTYFLSHGGGPWPWMMDRTGGTYLELERSLKDMRRELGEAPKAILLITAHWEEEVFTISAAERPGMIYDYYGFPPDTYEIEYKAPGLPSLAERAAELLTAGGMEAQLDHERGFDHGTYCVMQSLYPEAEMPVVQMSIRADYDPEAHLAAGRLLAPLREEGVLIVGSGLSYHNLRMMAHGGSEPSHAFDTWLQHALLDHGGSDRLAQLTQWEHAPAARLAHPREDHLIPLMMAAGAAADDDAAMTYHEGDFMGGLAVSSFRFGAAPQPVAA